MTWAVTKTDGTSCKSSFDVKGNGVLMVAADEEVGENVLTVTCTLNANANISATTSVTVEERKINSIKITPKSVEGEKVRLTNLSVNWTDLMLRLMPV